MNLHPALDHTPQNIDQLEHELRTPLASILLISEILRDHPELSEPERQRFLDAIHHESGRLAALVELLLRTGRLEAVPFN